MTNQHAIVGRSYLVILCAAFLHAVRLAHGDLCTDGVLSVEWLVDSSDEIHRVRFAVAENKHELVAEPLDTIKAQPGKTVLDDDDFKNLGSLPGAKLREEWLMFIRLGEDGAPRLVRGINLTRPLVDYRSAAITREGKPLRDPETILAMVEARTRLQRRLPPRCDRDAVDRMIGHEGNSKPPEIPHDIDPFGNPAPLDRYLGGVRIAIDCNYWGEDTWIHRAVVPIEPEDHLRLFEAARLDDQYNGTPRYFDPVSALVNFPGKEAESILKEIGAQYVLDYFLFCQETTDPLNKTLVGEWQLIGQIELIDITLGKNNTFTCVGYDRNRIANKKGRLRYRGKGRWVVRNGQLTIYRTYALARNNGMDWRRTGRYMPKHKPIIKVTPSEVILEGGPLMKRR